MTRTHVLVEWLEHMCYYRWLEHISFYRWLKHMCSYRWLEHICFYRWPEQAWTIPYQSLVNGKAVFEKMWKTQGQQQITKNNYIAHMAFDARWVKKTCNIH